MIGKKHLSMLIVLMFLASLTMVSVPVQSSPAPVTFYVEMPEGYIPGVDPTLIRMGIPGLVLVNVSVDASELTPNTTAGITGWGMDVQVDPDVLTPIGALAGTPGYLLYDFLVDYGYPIGPGDYWLQLLIASTPAEMAATGYMDEVTELILGDPPAGAGGTERLVTLAFKSKSETAYSPIQISLYQAGVWQTNYKNATKQWTDAAVINGHYNPPPVHTLTVESTPIQGINFTLNGVTNTTNWSGPLIERTLLERPYVVEMPPWTTAGDGIYTFDHWENNSTDPVRNIPLTTNTTITATYVYVPKEYALTVNSNPITGINFTLDGVANATNWSDVLTEGNYTVVMPSTWTTVGGYVYNFTHWEDASTNPSRVIPLTSSKTITATYVYVPKEYVLTVNSNPITGINFTLDGVANATNWSALLLEGTYNVTMPSTWMVGTDQYNFVEWEDNSTNPVRSTSLTSNKTITATYVPVHTLTVESTPIDGIDFTIDTTAYTTNATVPLEEGTYNVTMPSTWTVGADVYDFTRWEDDPTNTNPTRTISLTSNKNIIATYARAPIASFTSSPTEPIVAETVTFDASASNDPDGTIVSYAWGFGDGASGNGKIVEHAYTAAGNYNVNLTVTDNDGLTHTITKLITVKETPPPGIPLIVYVAAAGAAAIILAAIAFYFLKIKKPKPA